MWFLREQKIFYTSFLIFQFNNIQCSKKPKFTNKPLQLSNHSAQSVMNEITTKPNINIHKFEKDHSSSSLHS